MKYPRTYHLPNSDGGTNDDKRLTSIEHLLGKVVIISEKLDGENTSLHRNFTHARSEDSVHHLSRSYLKQFHATIKHLIDENIQIVIEYLYAKHSIYYDKLTSFSYIIGVVNKDRDMFLSIEETEFWSELLGIPMVPTIYRGIFEEWDGRIPKKSNFSDSEPEGYVIRVVNEFSVNEFELNVAKWVRKNHVQTNKHWTIDWTPNKLI